MEATDYYFFCTYYSKYKNNYVYRYGMNSSPKL